MECIDCDGKTIVSNTIAYQGVVYRKRICKECGRKFCTVEDVIDDNDKKMCDAFKYRFASFIK